MTYRFDRGIPSLQVGETILHPVQDYFLSDQWHFSFWPRKSGWNQVLAGGETAGWFYVYEASDWTGIKNAERLRQTKQRETTIGGNTNKEILTVKTKKEIPMIYFFLLFLLGASFLWYEQKKHIA